MSNLLEQASLVMIPSGYAEDIVYSEIPLDGSGDLQFTRASNGTRINSAGLVEVCPWNLASNSNDFGGLSAITKTSGQPSPIDSTSGSLLTPTGSGEHYSGTASLTAIVGNTYTFSVYAKFVQGLNIALRTVFSNGDEDISTIWNLNTGTLVANAGNHTSPTITAVGNGWYRVSITYTPSAVPAFPLLFRLQMAVGTSLSFTATSGDGFLVYGAQVNNGALAPYFPTTDRLNVPRLTYQNGGGGCPSLLLEKQSTNLFPNSQTTANWSFTNMSRTANYGVSPDGTQNADLLFPTTSGSVSFTTDSTTSSLTIGQPYVVSFFIKLNASFISNVGTNILEIRLSGAAVWSRPTIRVNLETGEVTGVNNASYISSTNFGNGWFRITFGATPTGTSAATQIQFPTGVTMDGGSFYIWGLQMEASTYATSYIPTTSSSATRVADLATVNLPNTNMTFTAYLELDEASLGTSAGDWFSIFSNVSALGRAYGYANTFGFADAYSLGVASGTKMVWKQESGSTAKIFKGGALVGTSTTGTYTDPFNRLRMDGALLDKPIKIKQFVYFDNALTDAECIQLTA